MNYLLDAMQSKSLTMNGTFIKELMMDDKNTIIAIMQDGSTIPAIDIEPDLSNHDVQQWIDNNPKLHEKVMLLNLCNHMMKSYTDFLSEGENQ